MNRIFYIIMILAYGCGSEDFSYEAATEQGSTVWRDYNYINHNAFSMSFPSVLETGECSLGSRRYWIRISGLNHNANYSPITSPADDCQSHQADGEPCRFERKTTDDEFVDPSSCIIVEPGLSVTTFDGHHLYSIEGVPITMQSLGHYLQ